MTFDFMELRDLHGAELVWERQQEVGAADASLTLFLHLLNLRLTLSRDICIFWGDLRRLAGLLAAGHGLLVVLLKQLEAESDLPLGDEP